MFSVTLLAASFAFSAFARGTGYLPPLLCFLSLMLSRFVGCRRAAIFSRFICFFQSSRMVGFVYSFIVLIITNGFHTLNPPDPLLYHLQVLPRSAFSRYEVKAL